MAKKKYPWAKGYDQRKKDKKQEREKLALRKVKAKEGRRMKQHEAQNIKDHMQQANLERVADRWREMYLQEKEEKRSFRDQLEDSKKQRLKDFQLGLVVGAAIACLIIAGAVQLAHSL